MRLKKILLFSLSFLLLVLTFLPAISEAQMQQRRARENFLNLWLLRMTQVLNLTEGQTSKIYPAVHRKEKEKIELQKQIGEKIRELKQALGREKQEEQELVNLMKEIKKLRALVQSKDAELEDFLEKNLTVEQKAKYAVFAVEFTKGMLERLEKARMQKARINK